MRQVRINVRSLDEGDARICEAGGELDAYTAPDLRDALDGELGDGNAVLVVDLKDLTYLDSTGLGILVGTAKRCRQAGGDLAVACTRPNLLKIFQISGTHEILNVAPSVEAAVERLKDLRCDRDRMNGTGEEDGK